MRLHRDAIVAAPGFQRWLVPPAALAVHLSIGQAYAYSVFKLPLTRLIGVTAPAPGDWSQTQIALVFTVFIVVLGLSAALFGRWVETAGPRKAGLAAACCWGGGYLVAALGVATHRLWLLYLGNGLIGGCGLGLGYISPVSTLLKWFPDRRGLATGMAIMGFGGGALIGAPLADLLMRRFATPASTGVWQTFVAMGLLYFAAMTCGALGYRLPPSGDRPPSWSGGAGRAWPGVSAAAPAAPAPFAARDMHVSEAWRTPAFGFLWVVLCANVSAGIGLLEQASPMIQEVFKGKVTASAAAGFVGLLSLFNIAGRIGWASLSDRIGRRATYGLFFSCGIVLYGSLPFASQAGSVTLFVAIVCLILTMYGGGFATIPAYLADLFGTQFVGAIHGRLLTAWSVAGVLGPLLVNVIRQSRIDAGAAPADAYNTTMWVLGGLLVAGFVCNLMVRMPVDRSEAATPRATSSMTPVPAVAPASTPASARRRTMLVFAWALVALPFLWGVLQTLGKASLLFR
ncbi:MAG TPA: OFA family MFS transporter [Candidatus Polarisedimenticolia bacterium]|nr:OFA family MFS transporter [Candidatus Polarisedimenticolia bacterium]